MSFRCYSSIELELGFIQWIKIRLEVVWFFPCKTWCYSKLGKHKGAWTHPETSEEVEGHYYYPITEFGGLIQQLDYKFITEFEYYYWYVTSKTSFRK